MDNSIAFHLRNYLAGVHSFIEHAHAREYGANIRGFGDTDKAIKTVENNVAILSGPATSANALAYFAAGSTTLAAIQDIYDFISSISMASLMSGKSETYSQSLVALRANVIESGRTISRRVLESCIDVLVRVPIDVKVVFNLVAERIRAGTMDKVYARLLRKYMSFFSESQRAAIQDLLYVGTGKLIEAAIRPIDPSRPTWEQVLSTGSLVMLTQSVSRRVFFGMFGMPYRDNMPLERNLDALAQRVGATLIFVSKLTKRPIEFEGRGLFSLEYIKEKGLITSRYLGLCPRVIRRFQTMKPLIPSGKRVAHYYKSTPKGTTAAGRVLVVETLTGNLFRIIGVPTYDTGRIVAQLLKDDTESARTGGAAKTRTKTYQESKARKPAKSLEPESGMQHVPAVPPPTTPAKEELIRRLLTPIDRCRFLVEGQTTRAMNYNEIMEDVIFSKCFSDKVVAATNSYKELASDPSMPLALRNEIFMRLRKIIDTAREGADPPIMLASVIRDEQQVYGMVIEAFSKIISPDILHRQAAAAVYYARLYDLTRKLMVSLRVNSYLLATMHYDDLGRRLDVMALDLMNRGLFDAFEEPIHSFYARKIGR